MKTPLPEKIETESGTQWVESSLPYKINQLIDRVAELSEVVDMNAMDIALTTYGNARVEEIIKIAEGMKPNSTFDPYVDGYNDAKRDLIKAIKK